MYEREMAEKNLILKVVTGSHLYGTNTKDSDKDYVGIFMPDKEYVLGLKRCDQVETRSNSPSSGHRNTNKDIDIVLYSFPKFVHLLAQNNPNIIEMPFVPANSILYCNEFGQRLLDSYPLFVSKKVKHTFRGYAYSQKQKLLHKQYEGSRIELVQKYGYDTKFASHLIRLLQECVTLLVEGRLSFPLPNNTYVRDIKIGKHSLESVLAKAETYEELIEKAYVNSSLPNTPDISAISLWQMNMLESFWRQKETTIPLTGAGGFFY